MSGGWAHTWVVFEHGTCVVLREPEDDIGEQARSLLAKWGPIQPGGSGGDFGVRRPVGFAEPIVFCHHPDILNYVTADELSKVQSANLGERKMLTVIGVGGRSKRGRDAKELKVIHVEAG